MDKIVLITGASRGIGRETARLFAAENYSVIINYYKSEHEALQLVRELTDHGSRAIAIQADVANREQVLRMVETAHDTFGKIDVLVNNAGISLWGLFTNISEPEWDLLFDVNVKGVFHCCQAVLPGMLHEKKGKIINISSIWGITGASCEVSYSATKAAVIGMTRALAKELGPSGIQVNCVAPGIINTDMTASFSEETLSSLQEDTPLGTLGTPRDIANTILFLASDKADFITGQLISPNGGFLI